MALSALVKICGVNNLSDARFCAGMGAGILGFCPEPDNPDFVNLKKYREITGWVQGVKLAGEFYQSSLDSILRTDLEYNFDYLQVSQPGFIQALKETGKPVIFCIDISDCNNWEEVSVRMKELSASVEFFLIQGRVSSEARLQEICESSKDFHILLGAGITKDNLQSLITQFKFTGFALKGSGEIKPGYLEPGELGEMMEILETNI